MKNFVALILFLLPISIYATNEGENLNKAYNYNIIIGQKFEGHGDCMPYFNSSQVY